jgi:hypothetical protein
MSQTNGLEGMDSGREVSFSEIIKNDLKAATSLPLIVPLVQ